MVGMIDKNSGQSGQPETADVSALAIVLLAFALVTYGVVLSPVAPVGSPGETLAEAIDTTAVAHAEHSPTGDARAQRQDRRPIHADDKPVKTNHTAPGNPQAESDGTKSADDHAETEAAGRSISLFDGKSLTGWKSTKFGGEGDVTVSDGSLILHMGDPLTGVTWQDGEALPRQNFEVRLQAQRVDGNDFFCGLTFRVGNDPLSLILGGWGGGVCGLSSLSGFDASENETTSYMLFETGRWYNIRLRVTPERIQAWVDAEQVVNVELIGQQLSIRPEVDLSLPFGFCSFATTAALRDIRVERLPAVAQRP